MAGQTVGTVKIKGTVDAAEFHSGLDKMDRRLQQSQRAMADNAAAIQAVFNSLNDKFAALFTIGGGMAAVSKLVELNKGFADIKDSASNASLSVEEFQGLKFVARDSGTDIETVVSALNKLNAAGYNAIESGGKLEDNFRRLGISSANFVRLTQVDKLQLLATYYQNAADKGEALANIGNIIGDKLTPKLINILSNTESLTEQFRKLKDAGLIASDAIIEKADKLDKSFDKLWTRVKILAKTAIVGFAGMQEGMIPANSQLEHLREELERQDHWWNKLDQNSIDYAEHLKKAIAAEEERIKAAEEANKKEDALFEAAARKASALLGKTAIETDAFKAKLDAISKLSFGEQIAQFKALYEVMEDQKRVGDKEWSKAYADAYDKLTAKITQQTDSIKQQVSTEEEKYKAIVKQVEMLVAVNELTHGLLGLNAEYLEKVKQLSPEYKKHEADVKSAQAAVKSLVDGNMTPLEKYNERLNEIALAYEKNANAAEKMAAQAAALKEYNKALEEKNRLSSKAEQAKLFLDDEGKLYDDNAKKIADVTAGLKELREKGVIDLNQYNAALKRVHFEYSSLGTVTRSFAESVSQNWKDVIMGSQTFSQAIHNIWKNLADQIISELMRIYVTQQIVRLATVYLGNIGNTTTAVAGAGSTNMVSNTATSPAGWSNTTTTMPGMATGGRIAAGDTVRVNEDGQEFFTPSVDGYIINARQTANMMGETRKSQAMVFNWNPTINMNDATGVDRAMEKHRLQFMIDAYEYQQKRSKMDRTK